ncbi:hypothetical protein F8S13_22670 [Chloroflexia bacterium SDU3-3]|nr:hypothetical protein F8S13_22670 [Chloroflexia bacterium SDU3-3]
MTTPILLAPGHVYVPHLGTGIQYAPGVATLYQGGDAIAQAAHDCPTAWAFWYDLAFARVFPQVQTWWFRSLWTQRARFSRAQGMLDATTVYGYVQYLDEETPGDMWTIHDGGDHWALDVPYPPNEVQPINLPLRYALAQAVVGVQNDDIQADTWYTLTSTVERLELSDALPTDERGCTALLPRRMGMLIAPLIDDDPIPDQRPIRLAGIDAHDPRAAWCRRMGLTPGA